MGAKTLVSCHEDVIESTVDWCLETNVRQEKQVFSKHVPPLTLKGSANNKSVHIGWQHGNQMEQRQCVHQWCVHFGVQATGHCTGWLAGWQAGDCPCGCSRGKLAIKHESKHVPFVPSAPHEWLFSKKHGVQSFTMAGLAQEQLPWGWV